MYGLTAEWRPATASRVRIAAAQPQAKSASQAKAPKRVAERRERSDISAALKRDHAEIRAVLAEALLETGPIGEAAHVLARLCSRQFRLEEKIVLPTFVVLHQLALHDQVHAETKSVLRLIARFARIRNAVLRQRQAFAPAIGTLWEAAYEEGNRRIVDLAARLRTHIATEDSLIYPVVLLIGKYLEERLAAPGT